MNLPSLTQARILIIDDNQTNIKLLSQILQKGGFVNMHGIQDSTQSIATIKEFQPDLVLLDLHMPILDGFEVIRQIRHNPEWEQIPILVVTADGNPGPRNKALAMGAKDFLSKPLDMVEVLLRIRNLLEARFVYEQLTDDLEQCRGAK